MYKFGIIGPGVIAHKFAKACLQVEQVELYGVASSNPERARKFAEEYQIPYAFESYDEMLKQDIDAVYIALVNNLHLPMIKKCLDHGKAVLCEKPVVCSRKEAEELISYVKQKKILFMEGMWTNFLPCIHHVKKWLKEEKIGRVRHIQSNISFMAEYKEGSRLYDPALGGGGLLDVGIYDIAFVQEMAASPVISVKSMVQTAPSNVDEFGTAMIQFENEIIATCTFGIHLKVPDHAYLYGEKGRIVLKNFWATKHCELYDAEGNLVEICEDEQENGFVYEIRHFVQLMEEHRIESPVNTFAKTFEYYRVLDQIRENSLAEQ